MFMAIGSHYFNDENDGPQKDYGKKLMSGALKLNPTNRAVKIPFETNNAVSFFRKYLNQNDQQKIFDRLGIDKSLSINYEQLLTTIAIFLEEFTNNDEGAITRDPNEIYASLNLNPIFSQTTNISPLDTPLLLEVNMKCPLTNVDLIINKNGNYLSNYNLTPIFPLSLTDAQKIRFSSIWKPANLKSPENLIAISRGAAFNYLETNDLNTFNELVKIKKRAIEKAQLDKRLQAQDVHENIKKVLNALILIKDPTVLLPLNYEALKISQKIPQNTTGTYDTIQTLVLKYYNFINDYLSELESKTNGKATEVAEGIKGMSKELVDAKTPIPELIDKLSRQINIKTLNNPEYDDTCKIVVAYFIQHCEVLSK